MATILLKRGSGTPTGLQTGEPAVDVYAHKLFIGGGAARGYPLGCQSLVYPKRSATPKIVGDVTGTGLTTLVLTASRLYFVPLVVPRAVTLTGLRISVTTSATGTAAIGLYANTVVSDSDAPGSLLVAVTGLNIGTAGEKTDAVSGTLEPGTLYWASVIASAAATLRALTTASVQTALGRQVSGNSATTHLLVGGSGSTLPDPAPTSLTASTASVPAIYLME